MAFRDNLDDPAAANRFAQHVGIAEDALEEIERIPRYIDEIPRDQGDGLSQEVMDIWMRRWATGWQNVWEQLREARAIVAQKGRDTTGFDAALAAAGDLYLDVASGKAVRAGNEVHVTWRNNSTVPAHQAIAALRAAMPEVVVVKQAPIAVDLAPTSNKVLYVAGGVAAVALVGYLLYRAVSG